MTNDNIELVLEMLDHYDGVYPRETIEEAIRRKDEITPYLIAHLEKLLENPARYIEEDHYACGYAFILLGHFREKRAHDAIMKIAALPIDTLDKLFGDMITEDFPWIFYATCGSSIERLKGLVLDRTAYEYCRGAAAEAIVYAVVDGKLTRKAALEFLGSHFTGNEADKDSDFWSMIASRIVDLYPEELMDVVRNAYETGLVDEFFIDYGFFEETLSAGIERRLERTRRELLEKLERKDVHSYMSWWACFNNEPSDDSPKYIKDMEKTIEKKAAKINKKKKKMAKASRKKNR